jgi:hypothetical protein
MEESTPYSSMKEISLVVSSSSSLTSSGYLWDRSYSDAAVGPATAAETQNSLLTAANNSPQHCLIRIVLPEGCLLLQVVLLRTYCQRSFD